MKDSHMSCVLFAVYSFVLLSTFSCANPIYNNKNNDIASIGNASKVVEPSNDTEDHDVKASDEDIVMHVKRLDSRDPQVHIGSVEYLISRPSKYTLECVINSLPDEIDALTSNLLKVFVITKILRKSGLTKMPWDKCPRTKEEWLEKYHSIKDDLNLKER